MGIEKIEPLEDKVRVHYHLQKPYGVKDVFSHQNILYAWINGLEKYEKDRISVLGVSSEEKVPIPNSDKSLIFVFDLYPESSAGPYEEDLRGVFLDQSQLENWVNEEINKKWTDFIKSNGVDPEYSTNHSKIPSFKVGESFAPSVSFNGESPVSIAKNITDAVLNKYEAGKLIEKIFEKISAYDESVLDGYHSHSCEAGTTTHIRTSEAVSFARNKDNLLNLLK